MDAAISQVATGELYPLARFAEMRPGALWRVTAILKDAAAAERVADLLESTFHQPVCTYQDLRTAKTTASVYLTVRPEWSSIRKALYRDLKHSTDSKPLAFRLTRIRPENWTESWKRHFKPLQIGRHLLIKPSWSSLKPKPSQFAIVLDPGMSFGTGQHPTTRFCLEQLAGARDPHKKQSFLDVGTGSGILAICAAKLGYRPVHALEIDADAVTIARDNARTNGVSRAISVRCQDLSSRPSAADHQYTVVCANLLADLLLRERKRLISCVAKGGLLVIAGILRNEFEKIRSAYQAAGLLFIESRAQQEWRSGAFRK